MAEDGSSLPPPAGSEGLTASSFRDLTAWRVTIPRVEQRLDQGKSDLVFVVDVTRIDVTEENAEDLHWEVRRRYHEFYILEAKLTEFHGEFPDNQLPPRRLLFSSKGPDFMYSRREVFEDFLQKLLQKPSLKGSQLLFLFLKSKYEFTTSSLPEVSIRRLIRDVPRKLIKERGQHLDSFISVFINSTTNKPKTNHEIEEGVISQECDFPILGSSSVSLFSSLYGDNVASMPPLTQNLPAPPRSIITVSGVVDTVLFVGVRVYSLSLNALRWANCLRAVVGHTLDAAVAWALRRKLSQVLQPPKIVKLIKLLQDLLFNDPPSDRNDSDIRARENELRKEVITLLPTWIQRFIFTEDNYTEGANTLVNLFQHPILNKQLSYVLLDQVIDELFPELSLEDISSPFLASLENRESQTKDVN